jgi:hypothetical protein
MEWAIGLRSDYSSATLRRLARRCGSGSSAFGAGGHFRWHACRPGKAAQMSEAARVTAQRFTPEKFLEAVSDEVQFVLRK